MDKKPNTSPTRKILVAMAAPLHAEIRHLGVDSGRTLADLLSEAACLLLEAHGRSAPSISTRTSCAFAHKPGISSRRVKRVPADPAPQAHTAK